MDSITNIYFYGNKRQCDMKIQEDAFAVYNLHGYTILMVADGQGGIAGSINTGQLAINIMKNYLSVIIQEKTGLAEIEKALPQAFYTASQAFLAINAIDERFTNVYSSLSVAIISEISHNLLIGSIGNTEIIRVSDGSIQRINYCHNEAQKEIDKGELDEIDYYFSPGRAICTSALGVFPNINVDISLVGPLKKGDILVLTTDCIFRYMSPLDMFAKVAQHKTIDEGVECVLQELEEQKAQDNEALILGNVY